MRNHGNNPARQVSLPASGGCAHRISGPLAFGYAAHFGLGLFVPGP